MGLCTSNEHQLFFNQNGESDEGHECYEEEGSEQDRQGQSCQSSCFPWHQGEDSRWYDQIRSDQEQVRQDREQEAISLCQEEQLHQGLDYCRPEARKALGLKGFVAIKKGSPLYNKAKELYQ